MAQRKLAKAFTYGGQPSHWGARSEFQVRLAKWYAGTRNEGAHGLKGGWIYTADMKPVAQGWDAYYQRRRRQIWEALEERAHAA